jgi:voltage-gated sodium channel
VTSLARRIVDAPLFQRAITVVIMLASVLVGLETDADIVAAHGELLRVLDGLVLGIFVVEIAVKLVAEGKAPQRYFRDRWNIFDFVIVVLCFMPFTGQYVTVVRLLRLLRVLRLLHALPRLQLLVSALLHSIPSMGYVAMFLGLLFYVYGVAAVFLFGANDPVHFGNLGYSVLSLFTVVTLEGWAELMYTQMYGCDRFGYDDMAALCTSPRAQPLLAPLYFVSFVLVGTMIVLNLFIGVIMNSMQEASVELERTQELERSRAAGTASPTLEHELFELQRAMHELSERVVRLQRRAANHPNVAAELPRET